MKTIQEKRDSNCPAKPKKLKVSKEAVRPAEEERQVLELERTFTDRWEW